MSHITTWRSSDGSVHHCNIEDPTVDIGSCQKLGNDCGPDCASITDDYGIGHIPPFGKSELNMMGKLR